MKDAIKDRTVPKSHWGVSLLPSQGVETSTTGPTARESGTLCIRPRVTSNSTSRAPEEAAEPVAIRDRDVSESGVQERDSGSWHQRWVGHSLFLGSAQYRVEAHLGKTTSGVLLTGHTSGPRGRKVAIKALDPWLIRSRRARLDATLEIWLEALFRDEHPTFSRTHNLGEVDGRIVLITDWVEGQSLQRIRDRLQLGARALPISTVVEIGIRLSRAVGDFVAWRRNNIESREYLPRGLSLRNIMLTPEGELCIIGPSLTRLVSSQMEMSRTGPLGGALHMSPEQANGDILSEQTDVYALGLSLWELLTLRSYNPCRTPLSQYYWASAPRHIPVSDFRSDVPAALTQLVRRCLASAPEDRPDSTGGVLDALLLIQHQLGAEYRPNLHQLTELDIGESLQTNLFRMNSPQGAHQ